MDKRKLALAQCWHLFMQGTLKCKDCVARDAPLSTASVMTSFWEHCKARFSICMTSQEWLLNSAGVLSVDETYDLIDVAVRDHIRYVNSGKYIVSDVVGLLTEPS